MTEAEALEQVKLYSASTTPPVLSDAELQAVLMNYVLEAGDYDSDGVLRAVADAWDLKTNKTTDFHSISVNGRGFSAEQVKQHCEERAKFYRRRIAVHVA